MNQSLATARNCNHILMTETNPGSLSLKVTMADRTKGKNTAAHIRKRGSKAGRQRWEEEAGNGALALLKAPRVHYARMRRGTPCGNGNGNTLEARAGPVRVRLGKKCY